MGSNSGQFKNGQSAHNKGIKGVVKHTQEWKEQQSIRSTGNKYRLGKFHSQETRIKQSSSHNNPEVIKRQSERMKGRKVSPGTQFKKGMVPWNKNLKGYRSKEKHHNWQGGITSLNLQVRNCFEYRQWRSDVFTRDNWTCQICEMRGGELNVDHYPKLFSIIMKENNIKTLEEAIQCSEFWNLNNGRTLCKLCHLKVTNKK